MEFSSFEKRRMSDVKMSLEKRTSFLFQGPESVILEPV